MECFDRNLRARGPGSGTMRRRALAVTLVAGLLAATVSAAGKNAPGKSAKPPAGKLDLQLFIDEAAASGENRIVIPPGRYRAAPRDGMHLVLRDFHDVTVVADDVELICTETTRALHIQDCRNLTIRGLTIDYDPLPFTQGKVVKVSPTRRRLEIEIMNGYPTGALGRNKLEVFDPTSRTLRNRTVYGLEIERRGKRRYHITKRASASPGEAREQAGDIAVLNFRHISSGFKPHAVVSRDCENLHFEAVTLYASPTFGFLELNCTASRYDRCRIDRRPADEDLKRRAAARVRSLNADAFHSKLAPRGPVIENCIARFQGDDCVNINGTYHLVLNSRGPTLRVLAKRGLGIEPGDEVEVWRFDGLRLPNAQVETIQAADPLAPREENFLKELRVLPKVRPVLRNTHTLWLDRAVNLPPGSVIGSTEARGNGFAVRNNTFGFNRSRGILIKASDGEVTGNTLEGCWMEAIKVAPEYQWLEAGCTTDVTIRDNTISNCHGVPIAVYAVAGTGEFAPPGAHENISIVGNSIRNASMPGIVVTSTRGLTRRGNSFDLVRPDGNVSFRGKDLGAPRSVILVNTTR